MTSTCSMSAMSQAATLCWHRALRLHRHHSGELRELPAFRLASGFAQLAPSTQIDDSGRRSAIREATSERPTPRASLELIAPQRTRLQELRSCDPTETGPATGPALDGQWLQFQIRFPRLQTPVRRAPRRTRTTTLLGSLLLGVVQRDAGDTFSARSAQRVPDRCCP